MGETVAKRLSDIPGDQLTLIDCIVSLEDKIKCLEREIAYREKVYGRLVVNGTMRAEEAYRQVAIMQAILEDYKAGNVGAERYWEARWRDEEALTKRLRAELALVSK